MTMARRFGGAGLRRHLRAPVSVGGPLLTLSKLTFSRSSIAAHLTSATTVAFVAVDELRTEDRGDGNNGLILLEGSATARGMQGENLNIWAKTNIVTSANSTTDPTGDVHADRLVASSAALSEIRRSTARSLAMFASVWALRANTTQNVSMSLDDGLSPVFNDIVTTTSWAEHTLLKPASGATVFMELRPHADAATPATNDDVHFWGAMVVESMTHYTSYIDTAGSPVTRSADILTAAAGSYPAALVNGAWEFDFAPYFASGELPSNRTLWSFGGSADEIRFVSATNNIAIIVSGAQVGISSALTFSRHQLLTIRLDWGARECTVSGATTGNGTFALSGVDEWPSNVTMRVGGIQGAGSEAFGGYSDEIRKG